MLAHPGRLGFEREHFYRRGYGLERSRRWCSSIRAMVARNITHRTSLRAHAETAAARHYGESFEVYSRQAREPIANRPGSCWWTRETEP